MEQDIIILSADSWALTDEATAEVKKGCAIWYIPGLAPVTNETGKSYGYKPIKESLPVEFIKEIEAAGGCPCNAKVKLVVRMISGKQVLKISECIVQKK